MKIRLHGWQRVGIVASVIWVLGAGLAQHASDLDRAAAAADMAVMVCQEGPWSKYATEDLKKPNCWGNEWERAFNAALIGKWDRMAVVAFVPVPIGWLIVYLLVWIGRWVRSGFVSP